MAVGAMETRVLIVGDDRLATAGLEALLFEQPDLHVVGRVANEAAYSAAGGPLDPQVVLWDAGWEPFEQLETLADAAQAGVPIVALVPEDVAASPMWATGIRGLLTRDAAPDAITAAVVAARAGLWVADAAIHGAGEMDRWKPDIGTSGAIESLTTREQEVLSLMAEGLPNKTIALRLDISEHTVKFHVNGILGKLGAQSRTEAAVLATRLGLLHL